MTALAGLLVIGLAVLVEGVAPSRARPAARLTCLRSWAACCSRPWSTDGPSETPTAMPTERAMKTAISETMW